MCVLLARPLDPCAPCAIAARSVFFYNGELPDGGPLPRFRYFTANNQKDVVDKWFGNDDDNDGAAGDTDGAAACSGGAAPARCTPVVAAAGLAPDTEPDHFVVYEAANMSPIGLPTRCQGPGAGVRCCSGWLQGAALTPVSECMPRLWCLGTSPVLCDQRS